MKLIVFKDALYKNIFMFSLKQIDHVAITVKDMEQSEKWYREVLGGKRCYEGHWEGPPVFVEIGGSSIALFPCESDVTINHTHHKAIAIQHFAFNTDVINFKKAQEELRQKKIDFHFSDHEISHSIYFNDPDGHEIEITTYDI